MVETKKYVLGDDTSLEVK